LPGYSCFVIIPLLFGWGWRLCAGWGSLKFFIAEKRRSQLVVFE
jgi:hypothetical protein